MQSSTDTLAPAVDASPRRLSTGRPRANEVAQHDNHLIDVAERLWLARGSLGDIAREAQVATRTIYARFGGKAGIARAILLRLAAENDRASAAAAMGAMVEDLVALSASLLRVRVDPLWKELRLYVSSQRDADLQTLMIESGPAPLRGAVRRQCLSLGGSADSDTRAELLGDMFIGAILALEYEAPLEGMDEAELKRLARGRAKKCLALVAPDMGECVSARAGRGAEAGLTGRRRCGT